MDNWSWQPMVDHIILLRSSQWTIMLTEKMKEAELKLLVDMLLSGLVWFGSMLLLLIMVSYGVVSTPEMTDWQQITRNDSYLIAASDGVFEKLTMQEVCDLLWYEELKANVKAEYIHGVTDTLADLLVNTAFERGTMDNMAIVVIPLKSSGTFVENVFDVDETSDLSLLELQKKLGNADFLTNLFTNAL
ncbi:hypothetical protein BHE74_00031693 [Ensete ventricosum]|nr:hypothetical protein GW17_00024905 [Ensete ventricosum]RWW61259.1 hypothetical protein BHE74_00031693 [Ensete ventricosum]